uniref:uncharacterized protein LOC120327521 n=1 Tax=Styela clava TaxID=7725 RepID=UPI001939BA1A|nr:uncharacterized protein LOC120327521 [Styela clava]
MTTLQFEISFNTTVQEFDTTAPHVQDFKVTSTWIIVLGVNILSLLVSLYISIALVVHNFLSNINDKKQQVKKQEIIWIDSPGFSPVRSNNLKFDAKSHLAKLEGMCIAGAVFTTLKIASEQLQLFLGGKSDFLCTVILKVQLVLYSLPILAIYTFLWARQRIMYKHPAISLYSSKKTQFASWYILFTLIIGILATAVVFFTTRSYMKSDFGCALKKTSIPKFIPWLILIGTAITFQTLLLALFLYPLVRHRQILKNVRREDQLTDTVKPVIKRVFLVTLACVISDVIAVLVTLATSTILISNILYDINLLVNMFGICLSFADWKNRLFPWSISKTKKSEPNRLDAHATYSC